MRFLELIWDIEIREGPSDNDIFFDFWSVMDDGNYLFLKKKKKIDYFETEVTEKIVNELEDKIFYFCEEYSETAPFLPYELLRPYMEIEVVFQSKVRYDTITRNPLLCVRGNCDKKCSGKEMDCYCFRELPCTNHRPDWNVWTCKHPNFYDMVFEVAEFVTLCPNTDTLVVLFDFTPTAHEPELSFEYLNSAYLIKGKKITIMGADTPEHHTVEKLYNEYNTKYPTEDRKIEESINYSEKEIFFTF